MKKFALMFVASAALVAFTLPQTALAHHSQAMYTNADGAISISGTVRKFDYTNPHSVIYLEVPGKDGKLTLWACEMQSLRTLKMLGWLPMSVKPGDKITIVGRPARDGAPAIYSEAVTLPDGRMMRS